MANQLSLFKDKSLTKAERKKAYDKAYKEANKEKIDAYNKAYREVNRNILAKKSKKYKENNKEKIANYTKKYREKNKDKIDIYQKEYTSRPVIKTSKKLRKQAQRLDCHKNKKTIKLIGCSAYDFWKYNGSLSTKELNNLHLDHIVPLSWFDLEQEDHVLVSSHWTNLQYLSSEDNLSKSDRYAGKPSNIFGYKDKFNIDNYVEEMITLINFIF